MIQMYVIITFVKIEVDKFFQIVLRSKIIDMLSNKKQWYVSLTDDAYFFVTVNNQSSRLIGNIDHIGIEESTGVLQGSGNSISNETSLIAQNPLLVHDVSNARLQFEPHRIWYLHFVFDFVQRRDNRSGFSRAPKNAPSDVWLPRDASHWHVQSWCPVRGQRDWTDTVLECSERWPVVEYANQKENLLSEATGNPSSIR